MLTTAMLLLSLFRPPAPEELEQINAELRTLPLGQMLNRPWSEQMQLPWRVSRMLMFGRDFAIVDASSTRAGSMSFGTRWMRLTLVRVSDGWRLWSPEECCALNPREN